jgi:hypothetical protein
VSPAAAAEGDTRALRGKEAHTHRQATGQHVVRLMVYAMFISTERIHQDDTVDTQLVPGPTECCHQPPDKHALPLQPHKVAEACPSACTSARCKMGAAMQLRVQRRPLAQTSASRASAVTLHWQRLQSPASPQLLPACGPRTGRW